MFLLGLVTVKKPSLGKWMPPLEYTFDADSQNNLIYNWNTCTSISMFSSKSLLILPIHYGMHPNLPNNPIIHCHLYNWPKSNVWSILLFLATFSSFFFFHYFFDTLFLCSFSLLLILANQILNASHLPSERSHQNENPSPKIENTTKTSQIT